MKQTITDLDHNIYKHRHLCVEDVAEMLSVSVNTVRRKLMKMSFTPHHRTSIPVIMGSKTVAYYDDEMSYGELPSYRYEDVKGEGE